MIVVADTSVILNLCCVKQADLLQHLFHEVIVPLEVASEFDRLTVEQPRFSGLSLPTWIRRQPCLSIPHSLRGEQLDPGETAALALALQIHADAVLIDERRGFQVARQLGFDYHRSAQRAFGGKDCWPASTCRASPRLAA